MLLMKKIGSWFKSRYKKFRVWLLRRAIDQLYFNYHKSFEDNLLEAQRTRQLPLHTLLARNKLNDAIRALKKIEPDYPIRELY